ncbi:type VI secretion system lipoprotein TssJ [Halopseudomonas salegens]|uniref:Type VI secretion system protein VasD n=1 Tax=Halopseudomonas salegens TaxID=1434072 RepID=A0A1H2E053_9GAMM|nr:type VI secretion system lipoprotein TssJ [Halopseudomonas salegens]SDT88484.1 type VI secretion system protein VasD [Halopseudomonas salegens]
MAKGVVNNMNVSQGVTVKVIAGFVVLLLLAGCAKSVSPDHETLVTLQINSSTLINPDLNERASPVEVHVYFLRDDNAFLEQDYFDLVASPEQALRQDLLMNESVIVVPGQAVQKRMYVDDGYAYVGVVASFRDLEGSVWRDIKQRPAKSDGGLGSVIMPTGWLMRNKGWSLYVSLHENEVRISENIK